MWNFKEWWDGYTKWYLEHAVAQDGCVGPAMSKEWARANIHSPLFFGDAQKKWEAAIGNPPPVIPGPHAIQYPNPSTLAALERAKASVAQGGTRHAGTNEAEVDYVTAFNRTFNEPGYEELALVLSNAYHQAAKGKGAERHANDKPFHEQPMQSIAARRGIGFILGQADKKTEEAQGMVSRGETDKAIHELLGAIVYLAGAIIYLEE